MSDPRFEALELYAWVGEDELGSGRIGLKQARVPAGYIPLVTMADDHFKIEGGLVRDQLERQAQVCGKRIRLCRFRLVEVIAETEHGE